MPAIVLRAPAGHFGHLKAVWSSKLSCFRPFSTQVQSKCDFLRTKLALTHFYHIFKHVQGDLFALCHFSESRCTTARAQPRTSCALAWPRGFQHHRCCLRQLAITFPDPLWPASTSPGRSSMRRPSDPEVVEARLQQGAGSGFMEPDSFSRPPRALVIPGKVSTVSLMSCRL